MLYKNSTDYKLKSKIQLIFTIIWILFLTYCSFSVFSLSIGTNVYSENYSGFFKTTVNALLPQGWGFFTRNPIEPKYKLYSCEGQYIMLQNQQNSSGYNFFGLSRKYRRYGYELTKLHTAINSRHWNNLHYESLNISLYKNPVVIKENKEFKLIKAGKYLVVKYDDIPWAWANDVKKPKIIGYVPIVIEP